ncbi:MAG: type II toxin-antitoxin system VapB family antitoxin [Gemmatimonadetes bacterium]|nr:type II toxin-antitoxin system VapB family antitoxin [Gemmatimonadota bacterium]
MALSIKNPETERLARELARTTGESVTQAVTRALRDRLVRETGRTDDLEHWLEGIREIQRRVAQLPVLETGTDEELLGYDENGLPT